LQLLAIIQRFRNYSTISQLFNDFAIIQRFRNLFNDFAIIQRFRKLFNDFP